MARRERTERESYWQGLIDQQRVSGQSIVAFCAGAGVSAASFHVWKRRLRTPRRGAHKLAPAPTLVPIRILTDSPAAQEAVTVEWPGGILLKVAMNCDPAILRTLVATLVAETTRKADPC